ncbi:MAG: hypothetical protein IID39_01395 [Planctomycetes bacterium]|nr:hypothetical protein [Planctomycetota bacterium]
MNTAIRRFADEGTPGKLFTSTSPEIIEAVERVVSNLAGQISIRAMSEVAQPTLSIE